MISRSLCGLFIAGSFAIAGLAAEVNTPPADPATSPKTNAPATARPRPSFWQGDASLTEEQRTALRELNTRLRRENRATFQKIVLLQKELEDAVFEEPPDAARIAAKAAEIGKYEGELALARAKLIAELRPKFTKEQLDRLKSLRGEYGRAERFTVRLPTDQTKTNAEPNALRPRRRAATPDGNSTPTPRQ